MSADNYLITDQNAVYFLTFKVIDRIDVRMTGRNLKYGDECCELQTQNRLPLVANEGQVGEFLEVLVLESRPPVRWERGSSNLHRVMHGIT